MTARRWDDIHAYPVRTRAEYAALYADEAESFAERIVEKATYVDTVAFWAERNLEKYHLEQLREFWRFG